MRNASVAEWMVNRFTSRERAASIVGDFVELESQKGATWFWLSVAGVLLSLCWRRALGLIVTFYVGNWAMVSFQMVLFGVHSQHRPQLLWAETFSALSIIGVFLWMMLFYGAICYGVKDRATQLALLWAVVMTAIIFFWWEPAVLVVCLALGLILVWNSSANTENRRAMLILIVTTITGVVSCFVAAYVASRYQKFIHPGLWGSKEVSEHPSALWVAFFLFLTAVWATTNIYSRMHTRMTRNKLAEGS